MGTLLKRHAMRGLASCSCIPEDTASSAVSSGIQLQLASRVDEKTRLPCRVRKGSANYQQFLAIGPSVKMENPASLPRAENAPLRARLALRVVKLDKAQHAFKGGVRFSV